MRWKYTLHTLILLVSWNSDFYWDHYCSHTHHKSPLLLSSLEAAVTKLGSGVNKLELNSLVGFARRVHEQRLGGRKTQRFPFTLKSSLPVQLIKSETYNSI